MRTRPEYQKWLVQTRPLTLPKILGRPRRCMRLLETVPVISAVANCIRANISLGIPLHLPANPKGRKFRGRLGLIWQLGKSAVIQWLSLSQHCGDILMDRCECRATTTYTLRLCVCRNSWVYSANICMLSVIKKDFRFVRTFNVCSHANTHTHRENIHT